jgi:hypothetical protein
MTRHIKTILILFVAVWISNASCEKAGTAAAADNRGPGGAGGSLARFAIVGNYLYVAQSWDLSVIDITNPAEPKVKGVQPIGFDIETIFPYKDKLYLGAATGLHIYSIADPAKPVKEGSVTHFRACDPVVSNDTISYVTLRNFGTSCGSNRNVLNVYDVKDAKNPKLITDITMNSPYGLGLRNKTLYVCEGANGLAVFDLADAYKPKLVKTIADEVCYDVIPYNDVLITYADKGVSFYDLTDPFAPKLVGSVKN